MNEIKFDKHEICHAQLRYILSRMQSSTEYEIVFATIKNCLET